MAASSRSTRTTSARTVTHLDDLRRARPRPAPPRRSRTCSCGTTGTSWPCCRGTGRQAMTGPSSAGGGGERLDGHAAPRAAGAPAGPDPPPDLDRVDLHPHASWSSRQRSGSTRSRQQRTAGAAFGAANVVTRIFDGPASGTSLGAMSIVEGYVDARHLRRPHGGAGRRSPHPPRRGDRARRTHRIERRRPAGAADGRARRRRRREPRRSALAATRFCCRLRASGEGSFAAGASYAGSGGRASRASRRSRRSSPSPSEARTGSRPRTRRLVPPPERRRRLRDGRAERRRARQRVALLAVPVGVGSADAAVRRGPLGRPLALRRLLRRARRRRVSGSRVAATSAPASCAERPGPATASPRAPQLRGPRVAAPARAALACGPLRWSRSASRSAPWATARTTSRMPRPSSWRSSSGCTPARPSVDVFVGLHHGVPRGWRPRATRCRRSCACGRKRRAVGSSRCSPRRSGGGRGSRVTPLIAAAGTCIVLTAMGLAATVGNWIASGDLDAGFGATGARPRPDARRARAGGLRPRRPSPCAPRWAPTLGWAALAMSLVVGQLGDMLELPHGRPQPLAVQPRARRPCRVLRRPSCGDSRWP